MAELKFTILGCGSSGGVPRLGGLWGECDPTNPKNHRRRCSLLVQRIDGTACTNVLIDTSPDLRSQLLDANIGLLDAVLFTHDHADHVHGLDDLRMVVFNRKARLPVYANGATTHALLARFGYAFVQPEGSPYPAILDLHDLAGPIRIQGDGGAILFQPFEVDHGSINALGFRIHDLAYLPDVAAIPDDSWAMLENLECWIVDALRRDPHPTHSHFANTLVWIDQLAPKRAVITNMHIDLDYQKVCDETPDHVTAAFDGMTISYQI